MHFRFKGGVPDHPLGGWGEGAEEKGRAGRERGERRRRERKGRAKRARGCKEACERGGVGTRVWGGPGGLGRVKRLRRRAKILRVVGFGDLVPHLCLCTFLQLGGFQSTK